MKSGTSTRLSRYTGVIGSADAAVNTVKSLLAENSSADAFVKAMKSAYPELPGSEGLDALAASLCK